jgi:hypothetical protein
MALASPLMFLYSCGLQQRRRSMALEGKKEPEGKQHTVYVTKVSAEHGDIMKQITSQLLKDTNLIEHSDFVLIANQKNEAKKPPFEVD